MKPPIDAEKRTIRLAAIDLDATLLAPDLSISPANRAAVRRLQDAGVEVVLASGRHHQTMRGFAEELGGVRWLVSVQGGEISDVRRERVLRQEFLPAPVARRAYELGQALGFAVFVYGADGIGVTQEGEAVDFYAALAGHRPWRREAEVLLAEPVFKVIWVGEPARISGLAKLAEVATVGTATVRTHQRLFEFVPTGVTKGTALAHLAAHLGIAAEEALAFGDAENDIPLFAWAGTSVAMPHGWPLARASATHVAPEGPEDTALSRAIELVWPSGTGMSGAAVLG